MPTITAPTKRRTIQGQQEQFIPDAPRKPKARSLKRPEAPTMNSVWITVDCQSEWLERSPYRVMPNKDMWNEAFEDALVAALAR